MKKILSIGFIALLGMALNVKAQELPQPSPAAKVEQRVGLTDISVEYSSPSVKGREIWGVLEKYDVIWRAGANASTKVTFSDDVKVGGKEVKAGTYAFFVKPSKDNWTIYLNSKIDGWGTGGYDEKNDVATVTAKPIIGKNVESLRYTIENNTGNSADLVLSWAKASVSVKIEVDVEKKAMANIEESLKDDRWSAYRSAANYMADNNIDLPKAKEYIAKSIELKESWYSYWVQADVLAANKDNKGASKSANKAIELGEARAKETGKPFKYKEELEKSIAEWSK